MRKPSLLVDALRYEHKGFSVIPLKADKRPYVAWEPYQERRAQAGKINEWWHKWPDANIGIVTGRISRLVVIDCDSLAGLKVVKQYIRQTLADKVPIVATGNGFHLYFRHPENQVINNRGRVFEDVDVRGDGGYVVAPPSIHSSGRVYALITSARIEDAPELPAELLTQIVSDGKAEEKKQVKKKSEVVAVYIVPSRSGGHPHRVRFMSSGHWTCSCLAFVKGHRECWAVKEKREEKSSA